MRRCIALMLVAACLSVPAAGCRVLSEVCPRYLGCDAIEACLRGQRHAPAVYDWRADYGRRDSGEVPNVRIDGVEPLPAGEFLGK